MFFLPDFDLCTGDALDSFSELELSEEELEDRRVVRLVSLFDDDDDELVLSDRLNLRRIYCQSKRKKFTRDDLLDRKSVV